MTFLHTLSSSKDPTNCDTPWPKHRMTKCTNLVFPIPAHVDNSCYKQCVVLSTTYLRNIPEYFFQRVPVQTLKVCHREPRCLSVSGRSCFLHPCGPEFFCGRHVSGPHTATVSALCMRGRWSRHKLKVCRPSYWGISPCLRKDADKQSKRNSENAQNKT